MKKILKINRNKVLISICGAFLVGATLISPVTVSANPYHSPHGFGQGQGRTDTINVNDFSTSSWDRFTFNYQFHSGMDYRSDLGRPTTWNGDVNIDPFTVNVRKDANVALLPPAYGVFSGHVSTIPSNLLFTQPNSWQMSFTENPHMLPQFDTLQMGVNAGSNGTILANTSIGGNDIFIQGANTVTNNIHGNRNNMQNTNSNSSSNVTFSISNEMGGFLTPTSIR